MTHKLLDPISSPQDRHLIEQYLIQSRKDADFLNAHWPDWVAEHPDKWVAVFEEEMVGLGDTFDEVIRAAEAKGAPRGRIVVEFLATDPIAMILAGVAC